MYPVKRRFKIARFLSLAIASFSSICLGAGNIDNFCNLTFKNRPRSDASPSSWLDEHVSVVKEERTETKIDYEGVKLTWTTRPNYFEVREHKKGRGEEDDFVFMADTYDNKLGFFVRNRDVETNERSKYLRGKELFDEAMEHFKGKFQIIQGTWISGDNLEAFQKSLSEGKTAEEAAFQTWTGKQAFRHGYTKVHVEMETFSNSSRLKEVKAYFSKP
jgi:hypothetical protein